MSLATAQIDYNAPATLLEVIPGSPHYSKGGPVSNGTIASEVAKAMAAPAERAERLSIVVDDGAIAGQASEVSFAQIKEIYNRLDFPGLAPI